MNLKVSNLARVALCAAATAALAGVTIPPPFSPVPVSGQTFGVIVSGLVLPPALAALSQVAYILLGLVGLPVFSGGGAGLAVLLGPTGGYIWGFVLGAFVISYLLSKFKPRGFWGCVLITASGSIVVIHTTGVLQLMAVAGLSLGQALVSGVVPFLVGDFLKVLAGTRLGKSLDALKME